MVVWSSSLCNTTSFLLSPMREGWKNVICVMIVRLAHTQ